MTAIWNFLKKLNRNQIMLLVGLVVAEGPDVAAIANFLASSGIPHLTGAVHFLGWLSTALASAAIAWPSIRSKLASFGLTTPPGALAPWIPGRPGDPNEAPYIPGEVGYSGPLKQTGDVAGKVLPMVADDAKTGSIRPRDKGVITGWLLAVLAGIGLGLCVLFAWTSTAHAQTPQFGTCFGVDQKTCVGPAVSITVGEFNLSNSKFSGGIIPGVGYGVTYSGPVALGAALYASFIVGQGQPNQLAPSLILSVANYIQLGAGPEIIEQPNGPAQVQWRLLFGLGTSFGGSPSYVKAHAQEAVRADRAVQAAVK